MGVRLHISKWQKLNFRSVSCVKISLPSSKPKSLNVTLFLSLAHDSPIERTISISLQARLHTLFSARLMTVTGKFQSPIGRLTQSTNRQSEFSSHSHELRTKKAQCKRALRSLFFLDVPSFF